MLCKRMCEKSEPDKSWAALAVLLLRTTVLKGRGRAGVKTLQKIEEFAWSLVLTKEFILWRRHCSTHSVQTKGAVQRLNNLAMRQLKKVGQEGRSEYI